MHHLLIARVVPLNQDLSCHISNVSKPLGTQMNPPKPARYYQQGAIFLAKLQQVRQAGSSTVLTIIVIVVFEYRLVGFIVCFDESPGKL